MNEPQERPQPAPENQPAPSRHDDYDEPPIEPLTTSPRKVWMSVIGVFVVFAAIATAFSTIWSWPAPDKDASTQLVENGTVPIPPAPSPSDAAADPPAASSNVSAAQLQQQAIQQARIERLRSQGETLRDEWLTLKSKADAFELTFASLLTDESGQRIAANSKFIDQYTLLRDRERPSVLEIADIGDRLDILLAPLDAINAVELSSDFLSEIDKLAKEIRSTARTFDQEQRLLDSLIAASKSQSPASNTLNEAIENRAQELAQAELESIRLAEQQARGDRVAELSGQAAAGIKAKAAAEAEAAAAQREYEKLKREALAPQVLALLAPFTTPDYTQPSQITNLMAHGTKTGKNEPVSLSKLQSLGVLDDTEYGMKKLAILNTRNWTKRPRWSFVYEAPEPNLWSEQQFKMIRQTQEYLNKYGAILVQEGKLAP